MAGIDWTGNHGDSSAQGPGQRQSTGLVGRAMAPGIGAVTLCVRPPRRRSGWPDSQSGRRTLPHRSERRGGRKAGGADRWALSANAHFSAHASARTGSGMAIRLTAGARKRNLVLGFGEK